MSIRLFAVRGSMLGTLGFAVPGAPARLRRSSARMAYLGFVALMACSRMDEPQTLSNEFEVAPVATTTVALVAQPSAHVFELRNLQGSAAPFVHVLDPRGTQVAVAKVSAASATVRLPGGAEGPHTVIVRARPRDVVSSADLWIDGALHAPALRFSAGTRFDPPVGRSPFAAIAVQPPNGAARHVVLELSDDERTVLQSASGASTRVQLMGGTHVIYGSDVGGRLSVYLNDNQDTDSDGLSDDLEREIGTCVSQEDSRPDLNCATIPDVRDTDEDGLWDGWEVLGYDAARHGVANGALLPLPMWGADPRHKDMFVEVDYRRLDKAENDSGTRAYMTPMVARQIAAIYGDAATIDTGLRAKHAASIRNPDGQPGIRIHLDTGQSPQSGSDATIYGDWGGYNPVDAVADPDHPESYIPATTAVWRDQMSASRHGVFRYVLGYTTGGGQCGFGVACEFNFTNASVSAHELGHSLDLQHGGPSSIPQPNCKPNYPSIMSYSGSNQFSDGRDLGVLNNHALIETGGVAPYSEILTRLSEVYRYKVDPATGSVDWNRDNRFSPANAIVRAYANFAPNVDCEGTRTGEQPTGLLSERSPAIVRLNNHLWVFAVTPERQLAYTLTPQPFVCQDIDNCPGLVFHSPTFAPSGPVDAIDAVVATVAGRPLVLLVGIRPDGTLFESWVEEALGRYVWGGPITIPASGAVGEPSLAVSHDGSRVALAYKTRTGTVAFRMRGPSGYQAEELITSTGPVVLDPKASPGLAYTYLPLPGQVTDVGGERLVAAISQGTLRFLSFRGNNQPWRALNIVTPQGLPRGGGVTKQLIGRPSLAWVGDPRSQVSRTQDAGTRASTVGRFYVVFSTEKYDRHDPAASGQQGVRMALSYTQSDDSLAVGLESAFDNQWSYAFGVDLLQPGEVALRAAETYALHQKTQLYPFRQVFVRPHADGINDLDYMNFDDWKLLASGLCRSLANAQSTAIRVSCAP